MTLPWQIWYNIGKGKGKMIKVRIAVLNPKFEIELETDDSDFEKFKKMLEYLTDKFQQKETDTPLSLTISTSDVIKSEEEKTNHHLDL